VIDGSRGSELRAGGCDEARATGFADGEIVGKLVQQQIIQMLREQGDHDKAQKAAQQLPDEVDHEQHKNLPQQFGISRQT
jgi:hypothetical protein